MFDGLNEGAEIPTLTHPCEQLYFNLFIRSASDFQKFLCIRQPESLRFFAAATENIVQQDGIELQILAGCYILCVCTDLP